MESTVVQLFFILLLAGLILIGAEVFAPGAVLGIIGGGFLLGAVITGFKAFPRYGGLVAIVILAGIGFAIWLWIKIFPKTRIGRKMTVSEDLATSKSADATLEELTGKRGVAVSHLRPAGFATIGGRRIDVVTRGEMISKNEDIEVINVEGSRVIVGRANRQA